MREKNDRQLLASNYKVINAVNKIWQVDKMGAEYQVQL